MVYSYNQEFGAIKAKEPYRVDEAGLAEKLWRTMKKHTDFGQWMGSHASNTPDEVIPLQAADLFAYELAKEFQNLRSRPQDGMRWPLRQILKISHYPNALIALMDRYELLRIIKESNFPCQENTEEIEDIDAQMKSARQKMTEWMRDRGGLGEPDVEDFEI